MGTRPPDNWDWALATRDPTHHVWFEEEPKLLLRTAVKSSNEANDDDNKGAKEDHLAEQCFDDGDKTQLLLMRSNLRPGDPIFNHLVKEVNDKRAEGWKHHHDAIEKYKEAAYNRGLSKSETSEAKRVEDESKKDGAHWPPICKHRVKRGQLCPYCYPHLPPATFLQFAHPHLWRGICWTCST